MSNQVPGNLGGKRALFPVVEVKRVNQEMKNSITQKIRAFQRLQNKVTPLTPAQRFLAFPGPQRTRRRLMPASRTLPLRPAKQPDDCLPLKVVGSSVGLYSRKNAFASKRRSQKPTRAVPETPLPGDEGGPSQEEAPEKSGSPGGTANTPVPMESNPDSPAGPSTSELDPTSS